MSKKRYTAALIGHGSIIKSLKRAWCTRFGSIKTIVYIPDKNETVTFEIEYNIQHGDIVTLTHRDNKSGRETVLFNGKPTHGRLKRKPHKKN